MIKIFINKANSNDIAIYFTCKTFLFLFFFHPKSLSIQTIVIHIPAQCSAKKPKVRGLGRWHGAVGSGSSDVDGNSGRLLGPDNLDRIPDVRHFGCTKGTFLWLHGKKKSFYQSLKKQNLFGGGLREVFHSTGLVCVF